MAFLIILRRGTSCTHSDTKQISMPSNPAGLRLSLIAIDIIMFVVRVETNSTRGLTTWCPLYWHSLNTYLGIELVQNVLQVVSLDGLLGVKEIEELLHELRSDVDLERAHLN